jgi:hypothetical protein
MRTSFKYPRRLRKTLSTYFLRHWDGDYLSTQLCEGTLIYEEIEYLCVFAKPIALLRKSRCILSFRVAQDEYKLLPVVMIDELRGSKAVDADGQLNLIDG